jgi:endonuclease YncB( thermonuclease family)
MTSTGLLEVKGTIDLAQFWPRGDSDADTSKVLVRVEDGAFRFRKDLASRFRVTRVFDGAKIKGRGHRDAISTKGLVTIRLQGIDAPELHYQPAAELKAAARSAEQHALYLKWNLDYRQPFGESATVALATFLATAGRDPLPCTVRSFVDKPNEVFDTYGRFVGEIFVTIGGRERSVNQWLVAKGWAVPTFYNSMLEDEISALTRAADAAYERGAGIWQAFAEQIPPFNFKSVYRRKNAPLEPDDGLVLMPKLYRRLAAWAVNKRAKMVTASFPKYLASKAGDVCFLTDDFLAQGPAADVRHLVDFVDTDGAVLAWPEQLVFKEAPSDLEVPGGGQPQW